MNLLTTDAILFCPEGSYDCLQVYFRLFRHDKRLVLASEGKIGGFSDR